MKKEYITPEMLLADYVGPLMENIGVGSNPDDKGDILGKGRKDDFEEEQGGNDSWSKGLW